jgi:hypothetical protein
MPKALVLCYTVTPMQFSNDLQGKNTLNCELQQEMRVHIKSPLGHRRLGIASLQNCFLHNIQCVKDVILLKETCYLSKFRE